MKTPHIILFLLSVGALSSTTIGCDDVGDQLTGGRGKQRGTDTDGTDPEDGLPAALQCTEAPVGRSYVLFDGAKLEDSRDNENVGVNRARVKPYATLEKEFKRVIGVVPASLKDSAGSFDAPPARWFGEQQYSGVSLHAMANIAFEGCLAYTKATASFASAPTADTAKTECTSLMRKAWSRSPSPEEIAGCADLVVNMKDEKDVRRRWAYACTSVLSSSQFLTF